MSIPSSSSSRNHFTSSSSLLTLQVNQKKEKKNSRQNGKHSYDDKNRINHKNGSSSSTTSSNSNHNQKKQKKKIQFINFWGSTTTHDDENDDSEDPLPCVTNLDPHQLGPLPKGAYYPLILSSPSPSTTSSDSSTTSSLSTDSTTTNNSWLYPSSNDYNNEYESATSTSSSSSNMDVCRLALQLDFESISSKQTQVDVDGWISQLHQCLDSGFTSFQWKNSPKNIQKIGQFKQQTPSYIHQHWTIPLSKLPMSINPTSIKKEIGSMIQQTSSETIDTLLIDYQHLFSSSSSSSSLETSSDYYHLDLLDILRDLQRDGLIRSVAVSGMSRHQRLQQITNGFVNNNNNNQDCCIQLQHRKGNLLFPPKTNGYQEEEQRLLLTTQQQQQTPIWWTDPYGEENALLLKSCLSNPTQKNRDNRLTQRQIQIIEDWVKGRTHNKDDGLQYFQDTVLEPLQYLALKYQVSQNSVILRSTMELAHNQQHHGRNSLVVPFCLSNSNSIYHEDNPYIPSISNQIQQLRNVFTFTLSEDTEDMEYINEITKELSHKNKNKNDIDRDYLIDNIPLDMLEEFTNSDEIPMELLLEEFHNNNNVEDDDDDDENSNNYPEIDFGNKALWL